MKQLIDHYELTQEGKVGKYNWIENDTVLVVGKYTGDVFDGSDRLSMSIMQDNALVKPYFEDRIVIAEGDRFTNNTFINYFNPIIIRINGDGKQGRKIRGTNQTDRHLKSIATRVENLPYHYAVNDSFCALKLLIKDIKEQTLTNKEPVFFSGQTNLF
jgi:hypothetical protein